MDAMGNLYIEDSGNGRIVKITTAGIASAVATSGLTSPLDSWARSDTE